VRERFLLDLLLLGLPLLSSALVNLEVLVFLVVLDVVDDLLVALMLPQREPLLLCCQPLPPLHHLFACECLEVELQHVPVLDRFNALLIQKQAVKQVLVFLLEILVFCVVIKVVGVCDALFLVKDFLQFFLLVLEFSLFLEREDRRGREVFA